jgi:hypothetical protein
LAVLSPRAAPAGPARAPSQQPEASEARCELFAKLCELRRRIVLANPLLDFRDIVFIKRGGAPGHCCDQYFRFTNGAGGGGTRSTPGRVGARVSSLLRMLDKGHHDVKLSAEELRRLIVWMDCNSNFFGAYHRTDEQARGVLVLPEVE